jgi:glutamyl/glutaminyl-tRNA synthetase
MTKFISRLAPTPSGFLHLGNIYNFALTWNLVRQSGGTLSLRIDDLDGTRSRREYVDDIFTTLKWLGFDWDHGPKSCEDFFQNYSQLLKVENYRSWLSNFEGYACECSRSQIKERTQKLYDGHCRDKDLALIPGKTQWRMKSESFENDVVLWRKEDLPAYHLVSVYEDLKLGSNLIVRGVDLAEASVVQKKMAGILGRVGEAFVKAKFIHHSLFLVEGVKMSKSQGATSIRYLKETGASPSDVWMMISQMSAHQWKSLEQGRVPILSPLQD